MPKINGCWIKRRWLDFRNGHGTYLIFVMGFVQFIILTYALAIERLPALESIFPSMSIWAVIFVGIYVPIAVIIGHYLHLKRQIPSDARQLAKNNPLNYEVVPGKEQEYNLPAMKVLFEYLLKNMSLHNQLAETLNAERGSDIQKYEVKDFDKVQEIIRVTKRLMQGENIQEIIK